MGDPGQTLGSAALEDDNLLSADGAGAAQKLRSRPEAGQEAAAKQATASVAPGPSMHCISSQSLLVLICSIGTFFVAYVCLVAYFFARRDPKMSVIKHQYH